MTRLPRVLVIYNEPVLPADHPHAASEHDIVETSKIVETILKDAGFPVRSLGFSVDPRVLLDELRDNPPDVVFNLFEGLATQTATEISVVSLLEWLNLPFTGSPSSAISLGRDKIRTKLMFQGAGLPTADFQIFDETPSTPWPHEWPAIVKPACQDSSVGIEQASVVQNQDDLNRRVEHVLAKYGGPVLVEQFVHGREFHVNFIEDPVKTEGEPTLTMIPLAEIIFEAEPNKALWPIYSYDAKWNTETEEYLSTPLRTPVELPQPITDHIRRVCGDAYYLLGLRDYGRLDVRLSVDGQPYLLEGNPNPYINSIALINGLKEMGRTHPEFIVNIVWSALQRTGKTWRRPVRRKRRQQPATAVE